MEVAHATGALLQEQPIVCGGKYLQYGGPYELEWISTDKCYKVTPNGFVSFTRMNSKRHGAARLQNFISYHGLVVNIHTYSKFYLHS